MRRFYYLISKSTRRTYGGLNQTALIYKWNRRTHSLEQVATARWCTASYMGEKSEVFQALVKAKQIPRKYLKSSECEWRSGGYFAGEVCNRYQINPVLRS